jgi:tetratricopeptide (TPR) repeat protein
VLISKTPIWLLALSSMGLMQQVMAQSTPAEAHFRQALEFRFRGNMDAAIVEYKRALDMDPTSIQGHDQLGMLLLEEKGDLDGAISEFMTALSLDPGCNSCQLHLNDAVDRRNSKPADQITRGNILYSSGDFKRAAAAYRIAVSLDPQNATAHNSVSWTLYKLGEVNEGLKEVEIALKLKPNDPEFVNTLACLQYEKGDVDAAITTWKKAIALSKTPGAADLYGLAVAYLSKGETSNAVKYFEQAIKTDPKYLEISFVRDRIGMSVHALAEHDKLVALHKKDK